jgi:hypothetical protein
MKRPFHLEEIHKTKTVSNETVFVYTIFFAAGRLPFLITVPGTLFLRASCFTSRLCFATPLDGRLTLVLTVVDSTCIAPYF